MNRTEALLISIIALISSILLIALPSIATSIEFIDCFILCLFETQYNTIAGNNIISNIILTMQGQAGPAGNTIVGHPEMGGKSPNFPLPYIEYDTKSADINHHAQVQGNKRLQHRTVNKYKIAWLSFADRLKDNISYVLSIVPESPLRTELNSALCTLEQKQA